MAVQVSYPGVYIEELSVGVRSITGVATSITVLVGWASQGPTDQAIRVLSWADYERLFGGLNRDSAMSYAVYQFFANGGADAYIMRIVAADATFGQATAGDLTLIASGPGTWAENYRVEVTLRTDDPTRFRVAVSRQAPTDRVAQPLEVYENLSLNPNDSRYALSVVNELSSLVNAEVAGPNIAALPATPLAGGADGAALKPNDPAFHDAVNPAAGSGAKDLLDKIDLFNILCIPGENDQAFLEGLASFCEGRRAFLIVDSPENTTFQQMSSGGLALLPAGEQVRNAAVYFPYIKLQDPLQQGRLRDFPPCGVVAGIYARTDATRGVWKAPAGIEASVVGARGPSEVLTDGQNGTLNPKAVNCIRAFPIYGTVVWGARTLRGQDEVASEWKYIPVRRTALYIEETLHRALKWVVFEPNDEPLWAQIRLNVGAFMHELFRQGAFQGRTPRDAYFVKCDKETTTQNDINLGIVNILVGFAPLKPAEFVIVKLQQMAGQIDV
jgi:uncharacterized protein